MIRLGETRSEDKSALICVYSTLNDSDLTSHFPQIYDQVQNHSTFQILETFFWPYFHLNFSKYQKYYWGKYLGDKWPHIKSWVRLGSAMTPTEQVHLIALGILFFTAMTSSFGNNFFQGWDLEKILNSTSFYALLKLVKISSTLRFFRENF